MERAGTVSKDPRGERAEFIFLERSPADGLAVIQATANSLRAGESHHGLVPGERSYIVMRGDRFRENLEQVALEVRGKLAQLKSKRLSAVAPSTQDAESAKHQEMALSSFFTGNLAVFSN
jgi:hypothetical protein